ncbi:hypothetical protein [Lysinibacillus sp. NPDC056232]|uniref:hypothetical protein n=1 Tax=Lysinibacillus sp. NPDC056232 TaxID=3345756 RepID=UPI0035D5E7D5
MFFARKRSGNSTMLVTKESPSLHSTYIHGIRFNKCHPQLLMMTRKKIVMYVD